MGKYTSLLALAKKLDAEQKKLDKIKEQHSSIDLSNDSRSRRAALSDKLTNQVWEIDKLEDKLHCELVILGLAEKKPESEYAPREVSQGAGLGHSMKFLYTPPKP
ncbi:hypothetical protein CASP1_00023 [Alcaligenes phage CASP1]|nr:hypothetical protein CASP1_00023 [Alcaligenes phage CASP1]